MRKLDAFALCLFLHHFAPGIKSKSNQDGEVYASGFLLLLAVPLASQELRVPCEAPPQTLRLLEAVPLLNDIGIPYESRVGALRTLAERNPLDFFIQRAYQDSFRDRYHLAAEFDRALARYRSRGPNALSRYYEARLLMYSQPNRSRATFEELLKSHPEFAWPPLEFVEWAGMPGIRKIDAPEPHMKAFRAACPDALPVGVRMLTPDDPRIFRAALARRNSRLDLRFWPQLWAAEEKAGIAADVLQSRIRTDIKRIQEWPFRPDPSLSFLYREASRILKDPALLEQLQSQVAREAPRSQLAISFIQEEWSRQNPPPRDASTAEGRKLYEEYRQKGDAANREWLAKFDYLPSVANLYRNIETRTMSGEAGVVSPNDLETIDRFLRFRQMTPDAAVQFPPAETGLARIYVAGKVRLDQVPKLLDEGLRKVGEQMKYAPSRDLFPEETRNRSTDWQQLTALQSQQIRADYLLAINQPADARAVVEQALVQLESRQPASPQERGRWHYDRTEWLRRLGDIDALEGRVEDTLAHYQASLSMITKESLAQPTAEQRFARIRQYYLDHGGTEAKWPEWATEKSGSPVGLTRPALSFLVPLPPFTAKDLAGRTWQLTDLNGKATLINFWATWCGPCRGEHPDIQNLYDRIRGRKDLQVLTISVDDSPSAVTEYVKEKAYTFPVIHSRELADRLFPYMGLPTNFLVNANGVRTSFYGVMTGSTGVQRIMDDLEKAAKGPARM